MTDMPDLSPEDREWIDARADHLFRESERARGGVRPSTVTPQDYLDYFVATAAWERAAARITALEAEVATARAEVEAMQDSGSWHREDVIDRLMAERDEARAEVLEQARLNGMGGEREYNLLGKIEHLQRELDAARTTCPFGDDCDLTVAYMAGASSERDRVTAARAEGYRQGVEDAARRENDPKWRTQNRVEFDGKNRLDEVVTDGWAHLERMDANRWFLNCGRRDGSSFAVWIHGKVAMTEERPVLTAPPAADPPPRA